MGELESDSTGQVRSANSGSIRIEGSIFGSELTMYDEHGEARVSLADRKGGGDPSLFLGRNDSYRTVIGSTGLVTAAGKDYDTSAASVVLFNPKGNVIWSAEQAGNLELLVGYLQLDLDKRKRELSDLSDELDHFKKAACPVLRTARMDNLTKGDLDSACGLH